MNRPGDSWGDQAVRRWAGGTAGCLGYVSGFLPLLPAMADSPRLTLMGVYILRDLLGILNIPLSPPPPGIEIVRSPWQHSSVVTHIREISQRQRADLT